MSEYPQVTGGTLACNCCCCAENPRVEVLPHDNIDGNTRYKSRDICRYVHLRIPFLVQLLIVTALALDGKFC